MPVFKVLIYLSFLMYAHTSAAKSSCECESLACNPCEEQQGMDFYTQKCSGSTQLKSCAKPICMPVNPAPSHCVVKNKTAAERSVASTVESVDIQNEAHVEVGQVTQLTGSAWVVSGFGKKQTATKSMKIYNSDVLKTAKQSKLTLKFTDSNEVHLSENTTLKVAEYEAKKKINKRKALIELIKGRVRSKVRKKYKGSKASYFRVKTRSAVAGVRGTDFVVELQQGVKYITKVTTLTGGVKLFDEQSKMDQVNVPAGHTASHVADKSVFDSQDRRDFVKQGYLTPVYKLSKAQLHAMEKKTSFASAKEPSNNKVVQQDDFVCDSPSGQFNQCYWKCVNNLKGESACRVDLPQVRCVKKRCNANGAWVEEDRVPASSSYQCGGRGFKIRTCDY